MNKTHIGIALVCGGLGLGGGAIISLLAGFLSAVTGFMSALLAASVVIMVIAVICIFSGGVYLQLAEGSEKAKSPPEAQP